MARLFDPRLLPIWLKSLAATLLACALLGAAGWWGLSLALDRYLGQSELGPLAAGLVTLPSDSRNGTSGPATVKG